MTTIWLSLLLAMVPATGPLPPPHPGQPDRAESTLTLPTIAAPGLNAEATAQALAALQCAKAAGIGANARRLAIIDYTLPSTEPRLWVFDLADGALLFSEHVAHGKGSGDNVPHVFSNVEGSLATSLGLYLTAESYDGENGYSLRLHGLSAGLNDAALKRLIVMHGADYVDPVQARRQGRLGRSWGCPAVRTAVARPMIDALKQGQFVFAYGPGTARLATCDAGSLVTPPGVRAPTPRDPA